MHNAYGDTLILENLTGIQCLPHSATFSPAVESLSAEYDDTIQQHLCGLFCGRVNLSSLIRCMLGERGDKDVCVYI